MRKLADIEPSIDAVFNRYNDILEFIRPAETMLSIRFMDFCEYALVGLPDKYSNINYIYTSRLVNRCFNSLARRYLGQQHPDAKV